MLWNVNFDLPEDQNYSISLIPEDGDTTEVITNSNIGDAPFKTLPTSGFTYSGKYSLELAIVSEESEKEIIYQTDIDKDLKLGANYQILLQYFSNETDLNSGYILQQITSENELHIAWLLPQFVIMTAGEIMFSITSLQFSFTQVSLFTSQ